MEKNDNYGRTINLKMKTPDFQIFTRSKTFQREIRTRDTFQNITQELLTQYWIEAGSVRLLGISVSNLSRETPDDNIQLEFDFPEEE